MLRSTSTFVLAAAVLASSAACSKSEKAASDPQPDAASPTPAADVAAVSEPPPAAEPPAVPEPAKAQVGQPAPDFTLTDLDGKEHTLSQYKGKLVVLEWFNPGCPFVNYAHTKGELAQMAKRHTADGVTWLAINSGAPGKQGHGEATNRDAAKQFGMEHPILIDEDGTVGHDYGAKKTPHMYVIDPEGILVYKGAIDNAPYGEVDGGGPLQNYVAAAIAALKDGKAIDPPETAAYGCTVKFAKG